MKRKNLVMLCIAALLGSKCAFCEESAKQTLNLSLPEILEIEKVFVQSVDYNKNDFFNNVAIQDVNKQNPSRFVVKLSPMYLKIHTNVGSPIYIDTVFEELKSASSTYKFEPSNLSFMPSRDVIENPHDGILSTSFTPIVITTPGVVPGSYLGRVLFTLGKI